MKRVYLHDVCVALEIDSATLFRWLKRAGIQTQHDEIDQRKRYITQADVRTLARLHKKHVPNIYDSNATQARGNDEYIDEQMNKLMVLFDSKLAVLQKQIDEMKEDIARLLADGTIGESEPLASFAKRHNVSKTTYKRYAEALGARKRHETWYLDAASKRAFYEKFHTYARFTPCPHCPHNTA